MPIPSQVVIDALTSIKGGWSSAIQNALRYKFEVFGKQAQEAMSFYDGSSSLDNVVGPSSKFPAPAVKISFNKVSEVVQLFGPTLYHDNPTRMITPMSMPDISMQDMVQAAMVGPQVQQAQQALLQQGFDAATVQQQAQQMASMQAQQQWAAYQLETTGTLSRNAITANLLSKYLNWTPYELDLRGNMRKVINEAVVKGMGCAWTDVVTMPLTGQKIIGTFYDSVDNYLHDPDKTNSDDLSCKWVAKMCIHPTWEVEKDFGLQPGTLKGNLESTASSMKNQNLLHNYRRESEKTNDCFAYWKIWSKMGVGDRLPGLDEKLKATMGRYGDYVYLCVADGLEYPLNLPPDFVGSQPDEEIMKRLQWPIPFYGDNDWPVTPLWFHQNFKANYPMSHIRFAMGEIQFMNWVVSMIAQKINITHRDLIICAKAMGEELENAIKQGGDLAIAKISLNAGMDVDKMVKFLQHPEMNADIMRVIPMVMEMLEKRLGINDLLYGQSDGIFRSASEAEIKNTNSRSRIDSMAKDVANCSAMIAKKEAIAARSVLMPPDIQPVMLNAGTALWGQYVASADATTIFRQLEYRTEESSVRTPNRERLAANLKDAMSTVLPAIMGQAAQTGDYTAVNNLIRDWGKSIDLDTAGYAMRSVMPPAAPGQAPGATPPPPETAPAMSAVGTNT